MAYSNKNQPKVSSRDFTKDLVLKNNDESYHRLMNMIKEYTSVLTKSKVTTHQIRNIFGEIKKADSHTKLWKLEVHLAYMAGRNDSNQVYKDFTEMLIRLIRETENAEDLVKFKEFFTALVAYHKFNEKFNSK